MATFEIPDGLLARCAGQPEVCRRVIGKFVKQMESDVQALTDLLESGADVATAARLAHRMKGASLNVEAEDLQQLAVTIEKAAESGQLEHAATYSEQIKARWADYLDLTREYLSEAPCGS